MHPTLSLHLPGTTLLLLLLLLLTLVPPTFAQQGDADPTPVYPTTALPTASTIPSAHAYTYIGCYNETTNSPSKSRALEGNYSANNTLTISSCLSYCNSIDNAQYAGIEFGRECYCAPYLSVFSEKINESECVFACNGNASEICGGALAITLYNRTGDRKTGVAWSVVGRGGDAAEWYGFAGLVALVIAAVL